MKLDSKNIPVFGPTLFGLIGIILISNFGLSDITGLLGCVFILIAIIILFSRFGTEISKDGERYYLSFFYSLYFKGKIKETPQIKGVIVRSARVRQNAYNISTKMISDASSAGKVYRLRLIYTDEKNGYKDIDTYYGKKKALRLGSKLADELEVPIIGRT